MRGETVEEALNVTVDEADDCYADGRGRLGDCLVRCDEEGREERRGEEEAD